MELLYQNSFRSIISTNLEFQNEGIIFIFTQSIESECLLEEEKNDSGSLFSTINKVFVLFVHKIR